MASDSVGTGVRLRRVLGMLLFLAAPALALGTWYSTREPLAVLAQVEQHRTSGDSAAYASAVYHASYARATEANRWTLTGYASLGLIGALAGAGLLLSGYSRRTA